MNGDFQNDPAVIEDGIDDATVARVERNIDGVHDFLQAVIADPSMLEQVPKGAQIVLVFDDDPALSEANLRAGAKVEREGGSIYVHRVKNLAPLAPAPAAAS